MRKSDGAGWRMPFSQAARAAWTRVARVRVWLNALGNCGRHVSLHVIVERSYRDNNGHALGRVSSRRRPQIAGLARRR
ncbi:protein of unknown function [Paraburkholderia kururiensis]